jgi:TRAP-type C4-dicarboxylate transport system substrate-binding protein
MSWGELYTALQQGTVDAQENPYAMIDDGKFYEVQKYASETGHVFSVTTFVFNKKFLDGLPGDLRALVIRAARESTLAQRSKIAAEEAAYKEKVIANGMQINELSAADKQPFVDATARVYAQFEGDLGKEIMDLAKAAQK